MRLSEAQVNDYRRDGFLRLPGLFSETEVAVLRGEVARVADIRSGEIQREADDGPPKAIFHMHAHRSRTGSAAMGASAHNLSAENRWQAYLCYNTCANRAREVDAPRPEWIRGTDFTPLETIDDTALLADDDRAA